MPRLARIRPVLRCTRRARSRSLATAAAFALVCIAHPSVAHEYWLAPSRYQTQAGQAVELGAVAGTGFRGERKPFASPHCVRFVARTAQLLDLRRIARDGEYTWARFAPSDEGGGLLAFESDFTPITLPPATFDEYLKKEGLDAPLAARRQAAGSVPGRERFRRCAKAWIAGSEVSRATVPIGLPLELVPVEAPGTGSRLGVRVLWHGLPLAGALVRAWRAPLANGGLTDAEARDSVDVAWQGRTDAQGVVLVRADAAGEWLVSVVHMVRCPDLGVADWESTWASLTFERTRAGR